MARLSPGIRFLLQTSWTKFAALAAFTFGLLTWQTYICIPAALIWVLALASAPLLFATRIHLRYRNIRAAANRCGAVLPPKWDGRLLGDFDIMQEMVESLNNGYPGMSHHSPIVYRRDFEALVPKCFCNLASVTAPL